MLYMVTFTINIPPMLAYIPYMDPMGIYIYIIYTIYTERSQLGLRNLRRADEPNGEWSRLMSRAALALSP